MKADWTNQIQQLEPIIADLKDINITALITYNGHPITQQQIVDSLETCMRMLQNQNGNEVDAIAYIIHHSGVTSTTQALVANYPNFVTTNATQPYADNFIGQIWGLHSSLNAVNTDKLKLDNLERYIEKNKSLKGKLEKLVDYDKALLEAKTSTDKRAKELETIQSKAELLLKGIEQNNQETTNLKTLSESNAVQTTTTKEKADALLAQITGQQTTITNLISTLEETKNKALKTLGLTSQVALASSFKARKRSLEKAQIIWIFLFILGLGALFSFTLLSISDSDKLNLPPVIIDGKFEIWGSIVRLLLSGPIIWLTWFSVKQFNSNVVLIEDYAFKEASAHAFVGYKEDISTDDEMVKLLTESAIKNFSYAPSRLITSNDSASPMHDLFESALKDKGLFDRLVELLRVSKPIKD